ncbi:short-chain dehydrogenase [Mycena capillaripes]|nr:short-chain dehydrogenase [Mycena capillaripes]
MRYGLWAFFGDQWTKQKPVVKADLAGKTVIVLGANTGIGFEATKHFASMNPGRLILACRSQSKGQAALDKLKAETGYSKAELWLIDLADFESVKQFADKFERDGGRLDILVENAGIATNKYEPTKDGWESSLQVNDVSTPLLALLLLPTMIKTAQEHSTTPRLVIVSSGMHYWVKMEKTILENPDLLQMLGSAEYCTDKNMATRYPLTKLLNVFFVRALNAHLPPSTPVIVNAVNPGYCYSELRRDYAGIRAVVDYLMERALAFTAEVGSRQLVWGAVAHQEQPDKLRGEYLAGCQVKEVSDFVLSAEGVKVQDRLWDELVDILGQVDSRVTTTVDKYLSH